MEKGEYPRYFVFVPPPNLKSNGITLLYEVARLLRLAGRTSFLLCDKEEGVPKSAIWSKSQVEVPVYFWKDVDSRHEIKTTDIVIYSESVQGNPLHAQRVVRYLMSIPGMLPEHSMNPGESDFLVSYSNLINRELFQLFILKQESVLNQLPRRRNQVAVHFGKVDRDALRRNFSQVWQLISRFRTKKVITRNAPRKRKKLIQYLAKSRLLVSFDPLSNLHIEATLLGTPVLVVDRSIYGDFDSFNLPLIGFCRGINQIDSFDRTVVIDTYQKQVAHGNLRNVCDFVAEAERHFRNMETRAISRNANLTLIAQLQARWKDDTLAAKRNPLANIDTPAQIPYQLCKRLDVSLYYWSLIVDAGDSLRRHFPQIDRGFSQISQFFGRHRSN